MIIGSNTVRKNIHIFLLVKVHNPELHSVQHSLRQLIIFFFFVFSDIPGDVKYFTVKLFNHSRRSKDTEVGKLRPKIHSTS